MWHFQLLQGNNQARAWALEISRAGTVACKNAFDVFLFPLNSEMVFTIN